MTVNYTKTAWKNNSAPYVNEDNLNNIENGIEAAATEINAHVADSNIHFTADERAKLAGIEEGASADMSAAEILDAIKTVDGHESGLDSDSVDGVHLSGLVQTNDSRLSDPRTPAAHASSHISAGSDAIPLAVSGGASGLMSGAEKAKLGGIADGAEVNVNADWNAVSGDAQILNKPSIPSALENLSGTLDDIANGITYVKSTNDYTTAEKNKLTGIEAGAQVNPSASAMLTAIKTVDGADSGLDADLLDGKQGGDYANVSHNHDVAQITSGSWPTDRLAEVNYVMSDVSRTARPLFDVLRADRTAFLPASQIIIETSTDAGATWVSGNVSDVNKTKLFNGQRPAIAIPRIDGVKNTNCMLRVTVTGMRYDVPVDTPETEKYQYWNPAYVLSTERYFTAEDMWTWVESNSDRIYCRVERATGANPNNWVLERECYMSGWSGGNYASLPSRVTFGGGTSQTGNIWNWRFTYRTCTTAHTFDNAGLSTNQPTNGQEIFHIKISGRNVWTASNSYMYHDHLYNWDENQNALFPANVRGATLQSTIASGVAPIVVASNTLVPNLNADLLDGIDSTRMLYGDNNYGTSSVSNFDTILKTGMYYGNSSAVGAPELQACLVRHIQHVSTNDYATQEAAIIIAGQTPNRTYVRTKNNGAWGSWALIWTANTDGAASGLDADLLDGLHASAFEPTFTKNTAFNKNFGTGATDVCAGNDARLSDARTPTAHTHTESEISNLGNYEPAFSKNTGFNKNLGTSAGTVCEGNDSRFTRRPFSFMTGHTEWATGLSNEEIGRIQLQAGETLVVDRIELQKKGGGTSADMSVNVYGTSQIISTTLGAVNVTPASSSAADLVLIRLTNSTGSTQSASVFISGWIT